MAIPIALFFQHFEWENVVTTLIMNPLRRKEKAILPWLHHIMKFLATPNRVAWWTTLKDRTRGVELK